jgi:hypothetical protein
LNLGGEHLLESYKFWRIYGGGEISYVLYDKSIFTDDLSKVVITNNRDLNKLLYGLYLSAGYNTINVYGYYGLNSILRRQNRWRKDKYEVA